MFDPRTLTPVNQLSAATNPFGGDQGGTTAGTGGLNFGEGQQHQEFRDAQGRRVMRIVLPNGNETYAVETGAKTAEIYDGSGNKLKDWTKRGALETVLGDEKFMSFLAVVAGGVAASYATGAAGAAGGGAAATTSAPVVGTGAAPAMGGITGTQALGGATAASSLVGSGSSGSDGAAPYGTDGLDNDAGYRAPYGASNPNTNDLTNINASTVPPETWSDIATRYGGNVAQWARDNPQLAAGIIGAGAGYLGNKDPSTATQTTTTALDPAAQAYRDRALATIEQYANSPVAQYRPGGSAGAPAPANWGGGAQAPAQAATSPMQKSLPAGFPAHARPGMPAGGDQMMRQTKTGGTTQPFMPTINNQGPMLRGGPAPRATPMTAGVLPGAKFDASMRQPSPMAGTPAPLGTGGSTPDWGGSSAYMPQVHQYLQQGTGQLTATQNPLAGENNPHLTGMIDSAGKDMRQYYDQFIAPKFSSGSSFGSSGLGFLEVAERDRAADNFSQMATGLRFQDHNLRAQLLGDQATRQDELNSGARNNAMTAGSTWGTLGADAGQFNANFDYGMFADQQLARQRQIDALLQGGAMPGGTTVTNTVTSQGNPWAGAIAGGVAGANLWKGDTGAKTTKNIWGR